MSHRKTKEIFWKALCFCTCTLLGIQMKTPYAPWVSESAECFWRPRSHQSFQLDTWILNSSDKWLIMKTILSKKLRGCTSSQWQRAAGLHTKGHLHIKLPLGMEVTVSKGPNKASRTWVFLSAVPWPILPTYQLDHLHPHTTHSLIPLGTCKHNSWLRWTKSREGFAGVRTEDGLQRISSSPMGSMPQAKGRALSLLPWTGPEMYNSHSPPGSFIFFEKSSYFIEVLKWETSQLAEVVRTC